MTDMIEALYDGKVFRPTGPIVLAPNTRVRMTIESLPPAEREAPSFLRPARAGAGCSPRLVGERALIITPATRPCGNPSRSGGRSYALGTVPRPRWISPSRWPE